MVLFALFVVPGLVFDLLGRRRRVEVDESAFREASRVVLASVALGVPGAAFGYVAWITMSGQPPVLSKLLTGDGAYYRDHAEVSFLAVVGYVASSVVVAIAINLVLDLVKGRSLTPHHSQWTQVFRFEPPPGSRAYVRVKTKSGFWWAGQVIHFTADLEVAGREITLAAPISRGSDEGTVWSCDPDIQRLLFRNEELESISVMYVRVDETSRPGRWKQFLSWFQRRASRFLTDARADTPRRENSSSD